MYKLDLGLGFTVFKYFLEKPYEHSPNIRLIVEKIWQHRIVLSDKIIQYYKSCCEDLSEYIDNFITANAVYDCLQFFESTNADTIADEFVELLMKCPFKIQKKTNLLQSN